jgi:hypothetical protein
VVSIATSGALHQLVGQGKEEGIVSFKEYVARTACKRKEVCNQTHASAFENPVTHNIGHKIVSFGKLVMFAGWLQ